MKELNRSMTLPLVTAVLVALFVVAIGMQSRNKSQAVRPVSQALIGGTESKHQGPWPECLGLPASDCVHIIKTYAEDLRSSGHVFVIEPDMMVTMDFDEHRVRVWVDESNLVNKIPKRG